MRLEIYSRRWGHNDSYSIDKTANGWHVRSISHMMIEGECDKKGNPSLYQHLDQDFINYPQALPQYMEFLWNRAEQEHITEAEIQAALDELGKWIQITEKATPIGIFLEYVKP